MNPGLDKEIVVLDAIMAYTGPVPDNSCRHLAHSFVRGAERIIENRLPARDYDVDRWIENWNREFGVA